MSLRKYFFDILQPEVKNSLICRGARGDLEGWRWLQTRTPVRGELNIVLHQRIECIVPENVYLNIEERSAVRIG